MTRRPNVVIVVADDLGPHAIAPTSPLPLPNFRALHEQSLVFENARASATLCAPGRYALMTGNLPLRSRTGGGEWGWPAPSALKPGQRSIAQLLREGGGYHTRFGGKWHLGGDPVETGFDGALFVPKGHSFPPYTTLVRGAGVRRPAECPPNQNGTSNGSSSTTIAWRAALPECLAAHARAVLLSTPTPLLYYHAASQKHAPFGAGVGMEQLGTVANASGFGPRLDAVVSLDLTMGVILNALKQRAIAESTVIVLTSDQGQDCESEHVKAHVRACPPARSLNSARSFDVFPNTSGYKGTFFEGGLRVPLWVRWPGSVHPGVSTATTATIDYVRTLLSMLRVEIPPSQAVDSADLSREWSSLTAPVRSRRNVFVANGPAQAVIRIGNFKASFRLQNRLCWWHKSVPFSEGCFEALSLYDLLADPMERQNRLLLSFPVNETGCMRKALLHIVNSASPPESFNECAH